MYFAQKSICNRKRVCVYNWLKCVRIKIMCVSVSRINTRITRKTLVMILRHLFCSIASLSFMLIFFFFDICHTEKTYIIIERITKMYITRVVLKMIFQIDVEIFVKIINCLIIFFWIFLTCESHFNLMFICKFSTRMFVFDLTTLLFMLIMTIMLNFFELRVKCMCETVRRIQSSTF